MQEVHFWRIDDQNKAIDVKYYNDASGLEEVLHKGEYDEFNDVNDADASMLNFLEISDTVRTTFGSAKVKCSERQPFIL